MEKPNRLIDENSLYLKMHAYNPVDWYPWGDEAFEKAISENKPIFLSIGYSSCHWCHVMEKESFEDEEVASFLNKYFVSIKVDKEERPDIDSMYMEYCILLNNSGGWPLSLFLTPYKEPFFAGTYFPKQNFLRLLHQIKAIWDEKHLEIISKSKQVIEQLRYYSNTFDKKPLNQDIVQKALFSLANNYDREYGGFSSAPKFPSLQNILLLLKSKNRDFQDMAINTLINMKKGGIYDHLGGGFHRYSTDRYWLLPHFEKMLYDQAMAILAYSEAYRLTKDENFKEVVYKTYDFVMEELFEDGYFYTAMDADVEGEEGGYYIFDIKEIKNILKERANKFIEFFNIKQEGNFLEEATKKRIGKNILYANSYNTKDYEEDLKLLKTYRNKRKKPLVDKKILLDQNALMDYALLEAYLVFDDEKFLNTASNNLDLISNTPLNHVLKHNRLIRPILDDYAFLIRGFLSLYKATFSSEILQKAIYFTNEILEYLWDKNSGGFYLSISKDVLIPQKPLYDGAIPSGNSVMALNFVELFLITKDQKYEYHYNILSSLYSNMLTHNPSSANFFLISFLLVKDAYQLLLSMPLLKAINYAKKIYKYYLPNIVMYHEEANEERFILCKDYTCLNPMRSLKEVIETIAKD